jgi:hypothetical protein
MFIGDLIKFLTSLVLAVQTPSGSYSGSKTVFGETIGAKVVFQNEQVLDFAISGAFELNCVGESYVVNGNEIIMSDIGQVGDCAHDALDENGVTLNDILYDWTNDQITVSVKYSIAKIDLVLLHNS